MVMFSLKGFKTHFKLLYISSQHKLATAYKHYRIYECVAMVSLISLHNTLCALGTKEDITSDSLSP